MPVVNTACLISHPYVKYPKGFCLRAKKKKGEHGPVVKKVDFLGQGPGFDSWPLQKFGKIRVGCAPRFNTGNGGKNHPTAGRSRQDTQGLASNVGCRLVGASLRDSSSNGKAQEGAGPSRWRRGPVARELRAAVGSRGPRKWCGKKRLLKDSPAVRS